MALVVIGGHSRSVGKTSVVAGLIAALREFNWTAVKITQYGHGICSANGEACDCATADHSWAISEERDRSGESDSSRFLAAGAVQALWARTEQGRLAEAMPTLRRRLDGARNVIIEGKLLGDVSADDRVELVASASVDGNIKAPKIIVAEGARFRGAVDMGSARPKETTDAPAPRNK